MIGTGTPDRDGGHQPQHRDDRGEQRDVGEVLGLHSGSPGRRRREDASSPGKYRSPVTGPGRSRNSGLQPHRGVVGQRAAADVRAGQQHLAPRAAAPAAPERLSRQTRPPGRRNARQPSGAGSHSSDSPANAGDVAPQRQRRSVQRQHRRRDRPPAPRRSAAAQPAGIGSQVSAPVENPYGGWCPTTASAPGSRRGRARCARTAPRSGPAAPRRAGRRRAGRARRRCRGRPRRAAPAAAAPPPAPGAVPTAPPP